MTNWISYLKDLEGMDAVVFIKNKFCNFELSRFFWPSLTQGSVAFPKYMTFNMVFMCPLYLYFILTV